MFLSASFSIPFYDNVVLMVYLDLGTKTLGQGFKEMFMFWLQKPVLAATNRLEMSQGLLKNIKCFHT